MGSNREIHGEAFGWMVAQRYELTGQGEAAERIADKWGLRRDALDDFAFASHQRAASARSEEHTSELQSLMRSSYAVFCLKKKKKQQDNAKSEDKTTELQS